MNSFDLLLKIFCNTPLDNKIVIDRILLYNSIHLPGKLSLIRLLVFYVFVVDFFCRLYVF